MSLFKLAEKTARSALNLAGVRDRYLQNGASKIHFYETTSSGPLPPVVLLHGLRLGATSYAPVILRLKNQSRRVVVPDFPGDGLSPQYNSMTPAKLAEIVIDFCSQELTEPAVIFGNSLGGGLALKLALKKPELVRALILTSPAGAPFHPAGLKSFLDIFRPKTIRDAQLFIERLYKRPPWYGRFLAPAILNLSRQSSLHEFLDAVRAEDALTPHELKSLPMPILFLWGRGERLMPRSCFEYFKRNLPAHAVIEEPEEFGHCPQLEAPFALAGRILDFVREISIKEGGLAQGSHP